MSRFNAGCGGDFNEEIFNNIFGGFFFTDKEDQVEMTSQETIQVQFFT